MTVDKFSFCNKVRASLNQETALAYFILYHGMGKKLQSPAEFFVEIAGVSNGEASDITNPVDAGAKRGFSNDVRAFNKCVDLLDLEQLGEKKFIPTVSMLKDFNLMGSSKQVLDAIMNISASGITENMSDLLHDMRNYGHERVDVQGALETIGNFKEDFKKVFRYQPVGTKVIRAMPTFETLRTLVLSSLTTLEECINSNNALATSNAVQSCCMLMDVYNKSINGIRKITLLFYNDLTDYLKMNDPEIEEAQALCFDLWSIQSGLLQHALSLGVVRDPSWNMDAFKQPKTMQECVDFARKTKTLCNNLRRIIADGGSISQELSELRRIKDEVSRL